MALELTPLETLPPNVERSAGAKAPAPLKLMAARGLAPLGPADLLTTLYQLTFADDENVKSAAFKTATELPERILSGGLGDALDARVLDFFARRIFQKPPLLERLLLNKATSDLTFQHLASLVDENMLELIAKNEERLLRHPPIIAALYLNPKTRMSTAQRALELAVRNNVRVEGIPAFEEAAKAIQQSGSPSDEELAKLDAAFERAKEVALDNSGGLSLIAVEPVDPTEASGEPLSAAQHADLAAIEAARAAEDAELQDEEKKQKISDLTPAGKIRLATLGNSFARSVLIRDTNKQVAMAAIRSPAVTDMEVLRYASNRGLDDDIVRFIANQRQWVRLYGIKVALVNNPKCPLPVAMRFLPHLNARDLKSVSRSKGIPSALSTAAKQMLSQRSQ
jgi:hypothetical protein